MSSMDEITVATSIPPKLARFDGDRPYAEEYQRLCVQSWIDCGFRILSINHRDEIRLLANRFPQVTFVEARRNAEKILGRKAPYIVDLLSALAKDPASIVGIINSDLVFEPGSGWQKILRQAAKRAVVIGQRYDAVSLAGSIPEKFYWGFDYFFFERKAIKDILPRAMPFAMGLPWWDYWLPVALAFHGRTIKLLERPRALHLDHGKEFSQSMLRHMGRWFAQYVVASARRRNVPRRLKPLIAACRKSLKSPVNRDANFEHEYGEIARICARELQRKAISPGRSGAGIGSNRDDAMPAAEGDAFPSFEARLEAGALRADAFSLLNQGRLPQAERLFRSILEVAPDDIESLSGFGTLLTQQGKFLEALPFFRRAVTLRPELSLSHTLLGNAFAALNRYDEAFACYERAVSVAPNFADRNHLAFAHYSLGRKLGSRDRPVEALGQIEKALSYNRGYREAIEHYFYLRQAVRGPQSPHVVRRELGHGQFNLAKQYFSRHGEDALLDEFFQFKSTGYFIDVGAIDGVFLSNTYAFERQGWTGLCVTAKKTLYRRCRKNRPGSHCVHADCTGPRPRPRGASEGRSNLIAGKAPSITLDRLLGDTVATVDFATIRAAGGERAVLAGFDLKRYRPRVLLIEANTPDKAKALDAYLARRGYRFARAMASNRFYVRGEKDRRALQAVTVSAKIERMPRPLARPAAAHRSPFPFVYWPAET